MRVTGTGRNWIVRAKMGGNGRTATLGAYGTGNGELTLAPARMAAIAMRDDAKAGVIPLPRSPRRNKDHGELTVATAVDRFITYCTDNRRMTNPGAYRW